MENYTVTQECCSCGERFKVMYYENGWYDYIGTPCECESDFVPTDGEPSICEWIEYLKH